LKNLTQNHNIMIFFLLRLWRFLVLDVEIDNIPNPRVIMQ